MKRRAFLASMGISFIQTAMATGAVLAEEKPTTVPKTAPAPMPKPMTADGPSAARFPDVVLTTHEGRDVRFYQDLVKGKVVLINFMYATCTNSCPTFTANLVRVQRLLGDRVGRDVFMYSISLDPEHDTPQVLAGYAKNYSVQPGWTFLTGSLADITTLRRRLGLRDLDPVVDADKSQHIGVVLYGNERFDRWAACPALSEPREIVKSVRWVDGSQQVPA
ncbi:MAG: SCO family protein [Nitrospirae bacterium]|nr:SCO family protein [Nitrospirota bacterium]